MVCNVQCRHFILVTKRMAFSFSGQASIQSQAKRPEKLHSLHSLILRKCTRTRRETSITSCKQALPHRPAEIYKIIPNLLLYPDQGSLASLILPDLNFRFQFVFHRVAFQIHGNIDTGGRKEGSVMNKWHQKAVDSELSLGLRLFLFISCTEPVQSSSSVV